MRAFIISLVLIFLGFYTVESHSQNTTIAIESNMDLNIEQVFELIKSKTDYQFVYSHDAVKDVPKIKISKGVIKVKNLLNGVLKPISGIYEFQDNHTIIVKRNTIINSSIKRIGKNNKPTSDRNVTIQATLLDQDTKQPIVFANIGFIKKGVGTISNEDGSFSLTFNNLFLEGEEILQISTLGYQTLKLNPTQLTNLITKSNNVLYLKPEPFSLGEVLITNTKRKKVRLGNSWGNETSIAYWKDKKALGGEIATKLNIKRKDTRLLDFKFYVVENLSDSIKIRINVYDYEKRYPTKKLLTENIYHVVTQKKGQVTVDLRPYNISVNNDVVIAMELIKVYGESINFAVSAEPHSRIAFKRYVSQDKWKRFDYLGVNFSVLTSVPAKKLKNNTTTPEELEDLPSNSFETINSNDFSNTISGKITSQNKPIPNVNIRIQGTEKGTKADVNGDYQLLANTNDIIEYSHINYHRVSIVVEDVTSTLNIEMVPKNNVLDEVVIDKRKTKSKNLERLEKSQIPVTTARGILDLKTASSQIDYIDGDEIGLQYRNITEAIAGKRAGVYPVVDPNSPKIPDVVIVKPVASINTPQNAIWDVDGLIYEQEPPMDPNNIKSIHILKTLAATNKYGSVAAGGVIVVRTKYGTLKNKVNKRKKIAEKFTNKNYYTGDALTINAQTRTSTPYTKTLEAFNDVEKAKAYYQDNLINTVTDYSIHLAIANTFIDTYNNDNISIDILNKLSNEYESNPEILKAIAYQYQAIGAKNEATKAYEQIFKLRLNYAQSYRDLANAYVENNQYKKGWKLYLSYLSLGYNATDDGIGQTIYNEMEFLHFNRKKQTQIKERFTPKNKSIEDFRNDIRIVVEWNTSEAEFDLEFVSPDKRAYVFEHTLAANQELIANEKQKGYSSKEFFIEAVGTGEWLMNLTYLGNKKYDPTYFKITTYYHWGKPTQRKDVLVYAFKDEREKIQLLKINKEVLFAAK